MDENDLIQLFENDKDMYLQWGKHIAAMICNKLEERGYSEKEFLKIYPVMPRVKDTKSFIEKALYRNKNYENPYNDITDKVGVRFVVLTLEGIEIIKSIVESVDIWNISCDRDFEQERSIKPELFEYQSVHYIIKNKNVINLPGTIIKENSPCEIQIRTLLQHAYAELSHDVLYKSNHKIAPTIRRCFAKSMALIETTDDIFMGVKELVNDLDKEFNDFITMTKPFVIMSYYVEKLNKLIYEEYQPFLIEKNIKLLDIKQYIENNPFLQTKVKNNTHFLICTQPIAYLMYYLISKFPYQTVENNPLTENEIKPFYIDLGIAI